MTSKDGAYVINPGEYSNIESHCIALYVLSDNVTYFDNFGVEYIPKEITKSIERSLIITSIYRKQACDSLMCGKLALDLLILCLKVKT